MGPLATLSAQEGTDSRADLDRTRQIGAEGLPTTEQPTGQTIIKKQRYDFDPLSEDAPGEEVLEGREFSPLEDDGNILDLATREKILEILDRARQEHDLHFIVLTCPLEEFRQKYITVALALTAHELSLNQGGVLVFTKDKNTFMTSYTKLLKMQAGSGAIARVDEIAQYRSNLTIGLDSYIIAFVESVTTEVGLALGKSVNSGLSIEGTLLGEPLGEEGATAAEEGTQAAEEEISDVKADQPTARAEKGTRSPMLAFVGGVALTGVIVAVIFAMKRKGGSRSHGRRHDPATSPGLALKPSANGRSEAAANEGASSVEKPAGDLSPSSPVVIETSAPTNGNTVPAGPSEPVTSAPEEASPLPQTRFALLGQPASGAADSPSGEFKPLPQSLAKKSETFPRKAVAEPLPVTVTLPLRRVADRVEQQLQEISGRPEPRLQVDPVILREISLHYRSLFRMTPNKARQHLMISIDAFLENIRAEKSSGEGPQGGRRTFDYHG